MNTGKIHFLHKQYTLHGTDRGVGVAVAQGGGAVEELRVMEAYKKQKIVTSMLVSVRFSNNVGLKKRYKKLF